MSDTADIVVVGAGIVGLALAAELTRRDAAARIVVVDKEPAVAAHQSGRNSGVLHTGVYYEPGSLKAQLCTAGRPLVEAFAERWELPWQRCGKVIVASDESEIDRLKALYRRGVANGVRVEMLDVRGLRAVEPHSAGVAALHVPDAGIIDYGAVCRALAAQLVESGVELRLGARVTAIAGADGTVGGAALVTTDQGALSCSRVVTCGGLYSDRLARMTGHAPDLRIVPFRGEYYRLVPALAERCRGLIYPVPDPSFPFLGVHLTRRVSGHVDVGPNAVLAAAREGYRHRDVDPAELAESLSWPGLRRLARGHWRAGAAEVLRSLSRRRFAAAAAGLLPGIEATHLLPAPAGVRAQALHRDGSLAQDFVITGDERIVHLCNAPSPAATSSFAIAGVIASRLGLC